MDESIRECGADVEEVRRENEYLRAECGRVESENTQLRRQMHQDKEMY